MTTPDKSFSKKVPRNVGFASNLTPISEKKPVRKNSLIPDNVESLGTKVRSLLMGVHTADDRHALHSHLCQRATATKHR